MAFVRKYRWAIIVSAAVLLGGLIVLGLFRGRAATAPESAAAETAVAFIGELTEAATASGTVVARRDAVLSAANPEVVASVAVDVGDEVQAGDVLVQLDSAALERAVASAEQDVAIAEADLAGLLSAADDAEVAAARAALGSAQTSLEELLDGPSPEEIAASQASVDAARASVWSASGTLNATQEVSEADIARATKERDDAQEEQQAAHDRWVDLANCEENAAGTYDCVPKEDNERMEAATEAVQRANAQLAIKQAQVDELLNPDENSVASSQAGVGSAAAQLDAAIARHEALLAGPSAADIAQAEADVASASATLESLLSGPKDSDVTIYETRLAQAQIALQEARNALADATISAPFGGLVTAVHVAPGELASGQVVELLETSSLEVVLSVDEVDVGRLRTGQPAVVTLETWPDVEITSEIAAIAPRASNGGGAVSYDVHLDLGQTDLPVLVGMTANADLITANREDVLLVPNAAITADRRNNTFTVNVVTTGSDGAEVVTPVEVTIGLRDESNTQITGGLSEGDVVRVGQLAAPVSNPFGPPGRN